MSLAWLKRSLVAAAVLLTLSPAAAQAQEQDYGAWEPDETPQAFQAFNDDVIPFSSRDVNEQTSFVCALPDGRALSAQERTLLSKIFRGAAQVYNGKFQLGVQQPKAAPGNGGYAEGAAGMQAFLRNEIQLLESGQWVDYSARQLAVVDGKREQGSYLAQKPGWQVVLERSAERPIPERQPRLASLIPAESKHPLELTSLLPEACALDPIQAEGPRFSSLIGDPGQFILDALLYIPAGLAKAGHDYLQPQAWRYAFWTPHTERGDLMWTVPVGCSPRGSEERAYSSNQALANCRGSAPVGFDGELHAPQADGQQPWFLVAAQLIQWLLTGVYLLIFFSAAIAYMFRSNRSAVHGIVRLVPRLLASIVLVVFAGWIIGNLITVSNFAVSLVFGFDEAPTVGAINTFLLQAGPIAGGSEVFQQLVELLVGATTVFFYLVLFLAAVARQVILVALIILAPLAALCLIVDSWRQHFHTYVRLLSAVLALPVVLALILRIGTSINPLILDPASAYGGLEGIIGLAMMVLTFYLMYWAIKQAKEFALTGRLQLAGAGGGSAPAGALPSISPPDDPGGRLISAARAVFSSASPPMHPQQASFSGGRTLSAGSLPAPGAARPSAKALLAEGPKRREGEVRLDPQAAREYRLGLRREVEKEVKKLGRRLSRLEVEQVKERYVRENGELRERQGAYYLQQAKAEQEGRLRAARIRSEERLPQASED